MIYRVSAEGLHKHSMLNNSTSASMVCASGSSNWGRNEDFPNSWVFPYFLFPPFPGDGRSGIGQRPYRVIFCGRVHDYRVDRIPENGYRKTTSPGLNQTICRIQMLCIKRWTERSDSERFSGE